MDTLKQFRPHHRDDQMTDRSFTLNCPRCKASLTVPGRPKQDIVVQCSECGHKGRLPRTKRGSKQQPVVLKAAKTTEKRAEAAADQQGVMTEPTPSKRGSILKTVIALAILCGAGFAAVKFVNRDSADEPKTVAEVSVTDDTPATVDPVVAETVSEDPAGEPLVVRDLITNEEVFRRVRHDLENEVSRFETLFTRYFTLTHLHNAGVSDDQLETSRNALVKLLNSLSWQRELYHPVAIDDEKTIYRVDVRDLKWTQQTWKTILSYDPYAFSYTNEDAATCADLTDESIPLVRADWFVFAASRPPLYHQILEIPDTLDEMASMLRVNIAENIREAELIRAGFRESEETQYNRIIERHKAPYGAFWVSYNFAADNTRGDIFKYPLGPGTEPEEFVHDGAQAIFNLPNGLQAYMTVDKDGYRMDETPANIYRKTVHRDKRLNATSCISCHASGIIAKADEVGVTVRTNRQAYGASDYILELYGDAKSMAELQKNDQTRFLEAMAKLNLPTATKEDEPVFLTSERFNTDLGIVVVAAELGLSADDLKTQVGAHTSLKECLKGVSSDRAKISRNDFLAGFGHAGETLGFGRSLRNTQVAHNYDNESSAKHVPTSEVAKSVETHASTADVATKSTGGPKSTVMQTSKSPGEDKASAVKASQETQPEDLFVDGGVTFVSFDGQNVKYKDKAGAIQTVAVDSLSSSDQESVLSQSVAGSNASSDLPDDASATADTKTSAPTTERRSEPLITAGKAKFISFDGAQNVKIQHLDGRSETVLIDALNSADIEFVLKQNTAGASVATTDSDDLPGTTSGPPPAQSSANPRPLSQPGGGKHVWHDADGKPFIEGVLHSFEPRRGFVRIAPVTRTWYPNGRPFDGLFHIAADIGGSVEVQVMPVGATRSQKFAMESLNQDDHAYLNMIRRGVESGQMKAVRSSSLKYWQIPIGEFSPADRQRILGESGIQQP